MPAEINKKFIEKDIDTFPDFIREKLNTYKSHTHKLHDYFGKKILQFMLNEKQINFTLSQLKYTEKERPFFDAEFDFNISHSGDYVVLIFSDCAKVGIDIELHRKIQPENFKKYFSDNEWKLMFSGGNIYQNFFDFWAIKEAAIKCNGNGLAVFSKTEILDDKTVWCDGEQYHYRLIEFDKNYSFAICSSALFDGINLEEVLT